MHNNEDAREKASHGNQINMHMVYRHFGCCVHTTAGECNFLKQFMQKTLVSLVVVTIGFIIYCCTAPYEPIVIYSTEEENHNHRIGPDLCTLDVVTCEGEKELRDTHKIIKRIAQEEGFESWEIIVGICEVETHCGRGNMVGDGGKSHGYYQIYSPNVCEENHNAKYCIKSADRYDLEKSTRWTIQRLKRHSHLGRHEMIRSHNGLVRDHSNDWYVDRVQEEAQKI